MGATAGLAMMIGGGIQAFGALEQARAQEDAANYNRAVSERNAQIARDQTKAEVINMRRHQYRELGAIRAAVGASGIVMDGSALDVLEMSVVEAELDLQRLRYSGQLKAEGYESDAELYGMQAKNAKRAGYFNATAALTGGVADMYGYPAPTQGTPVQVAGVP